jgi:hypothetical protein
VLLVGPTIGFVGFKGRGTGPVGFAKERTKPSGKRPLKLGAAWRRNLKADIVIAS